jgi:hypothetical protein
MVALNNYRTEENKTILWQIGWILFVPRMLTQEHWSDLVRISVKLISKRDNDPNLL